MPPGAPKEARGDLQPTDTECQHNIVFRSLSLESRGSRRSSWGLLVPSFVRIAAGVGHWLRRAHFHFSVVVEKAVPPAPGTIWGKKVTVGRGAK